MENFLIFVAPFLVVIGAIGLLFWLGGRKRSSNEPL
ncbi:cytochrome bd oxidase small subunit CydS [Paenibacillus marchantiophytorum]